MKLFLYSLAISTQQADALTQLVGKEPQDISFALIENAADVEPGAESWLEGFREALRSHGYQVEPVDLRNWQDNRKGLQEKLAGKDVIWVGGGNTFYLRWILRDTGTDHMIVTLVKQGKVYAGWSAGAIVAGPTLQYFDAMDDPKASPEVIHDGLHLTDIVIVPHLDNKHFAKGARKANQQLRQAGYHTVPLTDQQAVIVHDNRHKVI